MKKAIHWVFAISYLACRTLPAQPEIKNAVVYQPPFQAHSSNFMMAMFHLQPEDVQVLLPEGVEAKVNEAGMVTAAIEMYETDRIVGFPSYSIVFIVVEVKNFESNDKTPGHWTIWGKVTNKDALQSFREHFSFPYTQGEVVFTRKEDVFTGKVGRPGNELITLQIRWDDDQPFRAEGIVNMCSQSKDQQTVMVEVPWFSTGSAGELISFEVNPKGNKVLEAVEKSTPFLTIMSTDQVFSYSRPARR